MIPALKIIRNIFFAASIFAIAITIVNSSVTPQAKPENQLACGLNSSLSGEIDLNENVALFENREINLADTLLADASTADSIVLGSTANTDEKWIEVDLSEQKLTAWEGDQLFLETAISSGLPHTPTPTGEFRVWIKLRATKMEGGSGRYYYYLPNVPFVMFFSNDEVPSHKGYGLHGTYWHNDFGTPRSHGCVNLPNSAAEQLYYWTAPVLGEGKSVSRATEENPGTRIIIHQ